MNRFVSGKLAFHLIGWLVFLSLPVLFLISFNRGDIQFDPYSWGLLGIYVVFFYVHSNWMYPQLWLKRRYLVYGILIVAMLALVMLLRPFDQMMSQSRPVDFPMHQGADSIKHRLPVPANGMNDRIGGHGQNFNSRKQPVIDLVSLVLLVLVLALSIAWSIQKRLEQAARSAAAAEAQKTSAELSLLKAQINPHFLFNTLNNIYSLALLKDEQAPVSILQFANIMRYVTDESQSEMVSLESEIQCIRDYINLQQLRLSEQTKVIFEVEGEIIGKTIPPMLLITFIENSFKFGVSNDKPSSIFIHLVIDAQRLLFDCRNTIFKQHAPAERVGIGLSNARKRLQHLYPDMHVLLIDEQTDFFSVQLLINA